MIIINKYLQLNQINDVSAMADQNMERKVLLQSTILSTVFIIGLLIFEALPLLTNGQLAFLDVCFWLVLWSINIVVYLVFNA